MRHTKSPGCTPRLEWCPFQRYFEATRRATVQSWGNYRLYYSPLDATRWPFEGQSETDALAALMRLDFARLNEVMSVFRLFIKSVEGTLFPILTYSQC
jgi:hypothetical protein